MFLGDNSKESEFFRILSRTMKKLVIGIISITLLLAAGIACLLYSLSTSDMQMWILNHGVEKLSEKLQTRVSADSVGVDIGKGRIFLYGFEIDDRKNVTMLRVDTLEAMMQIVELINNRVIIDNVMLHGIEANLYKEKRDSAANYQFVIDAFKKDKKKNKDNAGKEKMLVALDAADLNRLNVRWNSNRFTLASMKYNARKQKVKLKGLHVKTNNGKPRKNKLKPHRGAFDAGHLNTWIDIDLTVEELRKDLVHFNIDRLEAKDKESGIDVKKLAAEVRIKDDSINIDNLHFTFGKATYLQFGKLRLTYSKHAAANGEKKKPEIEIAPVHLKANVDLRDISAAFAPTLSHFSTPLRLDVNVGGNLDRIYFNKIRVRSRDERLRLNANGDLCHVTEKERLSLHFFNIHLDARNGIKEQIINHFAKKVKLKMKNQMKAIGDIKFDGTLNIFQKKEKIAGCLQTQFGNVNAYFVVDGNTKFMTGSMSTDSLELGKIMNVKKLGPVKARALYSFDTASNKKGANSAKRHGGLPIGWLKAEVDNARFRMIHFKHISAEMKSDGSVAKGMVHVPQKLFDIVTFFEYLQTDGKQSMTVKPSITRHHKERVSLEDVEKKIEDKQQRKLEKQRRKEEKKTEKAERKAEKAARKAAEAEQKTK